MTDRPVAKPKACTRWSRDTPAAFGISASEISPEKWVSINQIAFPTGFIVGPHTEAGQLVVHLSARHLTGIAVAKVASSPGRRGASSAVNASHPQRHAGLVQEPTSSCVQSKGVFGAD